MAAVLGQRPVHRDGEKLRVVDLLAAVGVHLLEEIRQALGVGESGGSHARLEVLEADDARARGVHPPELCLQVGEQRVAGLPRHQAPRVLLEAVTAAERLQALEQGHLHVRVTRAGHQGVQRGHGFGGGGSLRDRPCQQPRHEFPPLFGDALGCAEPHLGTRGVLQDTRVAGAIEWKPPGQQHVARDTAAPHIDLLCVVCVPVARVDATHDLGCGVQRCAPDRPQPVVGVKPLRHAEVDQLHLRQRDIPDLLLQKQIVQLDIAVGDTLRVQIAHGPQQLAC
mmetsp:Transcript_83251/g.233261  ORF Transcript_83251/g.233261 Transcript_83251/m.233261 type:complete len:281 (-) Transcript_83251:473-1315(-)